MERRVTRYGVTEMRVPGGNSDKNSRLTFLWGH